MTGGDVSHDTSATLDDAALARHTRGMTKTQTTESPTRGLPTRKGGHMAAFHSTALFGTQTRAEVMYDELRDLESRLANPRHPFSGTVWHSRREARARVDYLRRALS